jgi:hypothetical protein
MVGNIKSHQLYYRPPPGRPGAPWPPRERWLLAALLLLAAVPVLAAGLRLYYLGAGAVHPAVARFAATPAPGGGGPQTPPRGRAWPPPRPRWRCTCSAPACLPCWAPGN